MKKIPDKLEETVAAPLPVKNKPWLELIFLLSSQTCYVKRFAFAPTYTDCSHI